MSAIYNRPSDPSTLPGDLRNGEKTSGTGRGPPEQGRTTSGPVRGTRIDETLKIETGDEKGPV